MCLLFCRVYKKPAYWFVNLFCIKKNVLVTTYEVIIFTRNMFGILSVIRYITRNMLAIVSGVFCFTRNMPAIFISVRLITRYFLLCFVIFSGMFFPKKYLATRLWFFLQCILYDKMFSGYFVKLSWKKCTSYLSSVFCIIRNVLAMLSCVFCIKRNMFAFPPDVFCITRFITVIL